jgi:hypothetical protein
MLICVLVEPIFAGVPGALGAIADLNGVETDATLFPTAFVART